MTDVVDTIPANSFASTVASYEDNSDLQNVS